MEFPLSIGDGRCKLAMAYVVFLQFIGLVMLSHFHYQELMSKTIMAYNFSPEDDL